MSKSPGPEKVDLIREDPSVHLKEMLNGNWVSFPATGEEFPDHSLTIP
jgi:hypothetical protein